MKHPWEKRVGEKKKKSFMTMREYELKTETSSMTTEGITMEMFYGYRTKNDQTPFRDSTGTILCNMEASLRWILLAMDL